AGRSKPWRISGRTRATPSPPCCTFSSTTLKPMCASRRPRPSRTWIPSVFPKKQPRSERLFHPMRVLAIGDIHGCLRALDGILDMVRPQPDDVVVALGDYADRGPDSRGSIDRLLE